MSNSKVNAPQNDIVIEMMKQKPIEKIHHREVFSRPLHGPDGISEFKENKKFSS